MQPKRVGDEYRTTMVCVDSYDEGIPVGRLFNPQYKKPAPFHSLTEFLRQMEDLMNDLRFPQPFTELRTFGPAAPRPPREESSNTAPEGRLATFAVKVIFRQNASWQGSVLWINQSREESFRSALELIFLLDGALNTVG